MLSKKIETLLNKQINYEFTAAYNYLAMKAWFENANLAGFANWMQHQAVEELQHAMKLFQFVCDRGGQVKLESVDKPAGGYKTPREVFAKATQLEKGNTKSINDLYAAAVADSDYATESHLKWFIDEQVEEEKTTREIEELLDIVGDSRSALLQLNHQLGQRAGSK